MYLISPNDYLQHAGVSAQTKEVGEILFHIHKISINITLKNLEDIQFFFTIMKHIVNAEHKSTIYYHKHKFSKIIHIFNLQKLQKKRKIINFCLLILYFLRTCVISFFNFFKTFIIEYICFINIFYNFTHLNL